MRLHKGRLASRRASLVADCAHLGAISYGSLCIFRASLVFTVCAVHSNHYCIKGALQFSG